MKSNFKIAHIIYVTEIHERQKASYLHVAQPLTMKSMIIAKQEAKNIVDVNLVATKHKDEKVEIPNEFHWAPYIEKYAWEHIDNLKNITPRRTIPRLVDIINNLYDYSDADYFIYTNLDIGLRPNFYLKVSELIEKGYDAFCINRKDLPKTHEGILLDESKIELINTLDGFVHPGIDCFVFKRETVPSLNLGNVFIGSSPIGQVLKTQIENNSRNFMWFKDFILTFHIGQDRPWQGEGGYYKENLDQAKGLYVNCFEGPPSLYRRFLNKIKSI